MFQKCSKVSARISIVVTTWKRGKQREIRSQRTTLSSSSREMDALPNEVLIKILWYFHPVYENLSGYALVCRKWDDILRHTASLWHHIHLEDDASARPGMTNEYEKVLLSCLKTFGNFINCIRSEEEPYFANPQLRAVLPLLPNLRTLDVPVLAWSRIFAQSLQSAPNLKSLTIDDYRGFLETAPDGEISESRLHRKGLRLWDMNVLSLHFPKLETLTLNICFYKLCQSDLLPVLDAMHLKDLRLECVPFGMNELRMRRNNEVSPIKSLVLSRHASIVTLLELCNLPITLNDLVLFLKNLKNLRHLATGVQCTNEYRCNASTWLLESQCLLVFVLYGMKSPQNERLKCIMPNLEVAMLSECDSLESFEVHAKKLLQFSARGNCNLKVISAVCQRIEEVEVHDCPSLELQNLRDFLSRIPVIGRLDICGQDWHTLELDKKCCKEIRKVIIRDVSVFYSVIRINCPTLSVFICTGDVDPNKGLSDPAIFGCEISIRADNLKKVQINEVYSARRISIKCKTLDLVQIGGLYPWQSPVKFVFKAAQRIGAIDLKRVPVNGLQVNAPVVASILMGACSLTNKTASCDIRCGVVQALRLVRCNEITQFSLGTLKVTKFSADSCTELRELDMEHAKVGRVRISDCPHLNPRDESFVHGLSND